MFPNIYFPWHIQYSEAEYEQIVQYQMFLPQLYQENHWNNSTSFQNLNYESLRSKGFQRCLFTDNQFQEKKMVSQITETQKQQNSYKDNDSNLMKLSNKTRQKYGRNITSNIFRSLVKRISNQNHFKKLTSRIIQQKKFQIRYEKFIDLINTSTIDLGSYVKKNQMKSFIIPKAGDKQSYEFCTIFRILANIYLRQQHTLNIFYSKKINRDSRSLHFVLARQMEQMFK